MNIPHVTWLRAFEAAARHASFAAAAAELNLTAAAVSQQIRLLEKHLGVQLFHRNARGVTLTDIGQAYAQPLRKSFAELATATQSLFAGKHRRTLRIRASISYATLVLAPALPRFHAAHPEVDVHLTTTIWADRMDDDTLDIDIRHGNGDWPESDIRHLGHDCATVICAPATHAERPTIEALAMGPVLQIIGSEGEWSRLGLAFDLTLPAPQDLTRVDSSLLALQMAASGYGCAIILESYQRSYLAAGTLVSPHPYRLPILQSHFLVVNDASDHLAEAHRFCDWMLAEPGTP